MDHLLRQTRMHHVQLSSMADVKANMLLTMASVVVSLSLPHLFQSDLKWPLMVLITCCLVTIALAVYAVMPKFPLWPKPQGKPDLFSPRFNLLFFGDFTRLDYEEYESAMESVLNDPSQTYEVQVRELYTLGTFLATKKYRFLQLAYLTFMVGLFASFILVLATKVFA